MPIQTLLTIAAAAGCVTAACALVMATVALLLYLRIRGWHLPSVQMDLAALALRKKRGDYRVWPGKHR